MDLSKEINKILTDYASDVDKTMLKVEDEVANEAVKKLKSTSPKKKKGSGKGRYAKGWTIDKKAKAKYAQTIIHNRTDYQLTHLLENGHNVVRNGRVVGYVSPQPHIKPVEEWVQKEMVERIEERL